MSAQSPVQPRAVCWISVCEGKKRSTFSVHTLLKVHLPEYFKTIPVLILTHEGASAAYEAEKAAFRWESSTFTAEKTEREEG